MCGVCGAVAGWRCGGGRAGITTEWSGEGDRGAVVGGRAERGGGQGDRQKQGYHR